MKRDADGTEHCPCGRPLHYPNPRTEAYVRDRIAANGPTVTVHTSAGVYAVPRHYIALHGLKVHEIAELAKKYGFQLISDGDKRV
jgi:hypothetical protein